MVLPNLIIAGPPKTGTTSLFEWLAKHPEVCASSKKETSFFSDVISKANHDCNFQQHGIDAYQNLFPEYSNEKIILEATPEYIYTETAQSQIPKLASNPLIIFLYRNPADRILSEYKFHKYKTKRFDGSLHEFINQDKIRDKIDPYPYYMKWIAKTENLKILLFEDLKNNPKELMLELSNLLGIDGAFYHDFEFRTKNESVALKSKFIHDLSFKVSNLIPRSLKNFLTPVYFNVNSRKISDFSSHDLDTITELQNRFEGNEKHLVKFKEFVLQTFKV